MKNKIILKFVLLILYFIIGWTVWAQEENQIKDFYSPYFIGSTSSTTSSMSPQSDTINPSAAALIQRVTLNLNFVGILEQNNSFGGQKGYGINIGNTIPTKAGVFTWSGHYLTSPFPSVDSNSIFSFNSSFAKELYPNLLSGFGVKLAGASKSTMASLFDLGIIFLSGDSKFLKDLRWAVVLQDLGYTDISNGYPDPFTITGGISADIISTENFIINVSTDIGFPDFNSIFLTMGSNISFRDIFSLNFGTRLDSNAFIHSIGINYSFKTDIKKENNFLGLYEKGWSRSEINIQTGFAPISEDLFATGFGVNIPLGVIDKTPPVIKLNISDFETDDNKDETPKDTNKEREDDTLSKLPLLKLQTKKLSGKKNLRKIIIPIQSKNGKNANKTISFVKQEKKTGRYDKKYPSSKISVYASPNNDGIKDELTFPITISDSRYITGYTFVIKDADGIIVRDIKNKEKRAENQGFSGFFDRLFSVKSRLEIPDEFRWDGLSNDGSAVSDGIYYFYVEAWDDNGNTGHSDSFAIVIDSIPPKLELTEPSDDYKIFSPNGDGNKDIISILQNGSDEDLWSAAIVDSLGVSVKTYSWIDQRPSTVEWDGLDDNGIMVADGVYSYSINSLDRAGNSVNSGFNNIIKNTEETPITLMIDKANFSPNDDMVFDSLLLALGIPVKEGIVEWNLDIQKKDGKIVRSFSGGTNVPNEILFDGRDKDAIRLKEGSYFGSINVFYRNGNNPKSKSPIFNIDITKPLARLKSDISIFSPNGDGSKDEITFYQESSPEIRWSGIIKSESGKIITEYEWIIAADPSVDWNGTLPSGKLAPDGKYSYQLVSVDSAGNTGKSKVIEFTLNTEETPVILTTDLEYFSPNSDSVQDTISIIPELKVKNGIDSYSLNILNSQLVVIRSFSGKNTIPREIVWNGIGSDGRIVDDGRYSSDITVVYKNGNSSSASSRQFIIDTVYPEVSAVTKYLLFSPDSDGQKDNLEIIQSSSFEDIWQAEISSENNKIVKNYSWKGLVKDLKWDATDNEGNKVPDGKYQYTLFSMDAAGNKSSAEVKKIEIDTKPTSIFLTASSKYLSPTGNNLYEDITFSTIINNKRGLESWLVKIIHESGIVEKTFQGNKSIPKDITWNGVNDSNEIVEGNYIAQFSASYLKGNTPIVRTSWFILDISSPVGAVNLTPVPFSPDNDGLDDEIAININVTDASEIKKWRLEIDDPENRLFKTYSGEGEPTEKIIWDGKSLNGELVYAAMDYPFKLTLEDKLGNISRIIDKIPVDVLIVREGDILKIKIANIIFKKNSSELLADSQKVIQQNKYILNRVSELLNKYNSYKITVEGHAVVTKWNDPVAAKIEEDTELKPLSEKRALTVLNYLTKLGISPSRMNYKGAGGQKPLVPHSNIENRWKNRRVEFILWKE